MIATNLVFILTASLPVAYLVGRARGMRAYQRLHGQRADLRKAIERTSR